MIRLRGVSKSFGSQLVLDQIDMDIATGTRLCIVGGSGAGKSVLTKLILGLEEPDAGEIFIDDQAVGDFRPGDWQRVLYDFGVVFQGAALFDSLSVLENVGIRLFEARELPPGEIVTQVEAALRLVGLSPEVMSKYPAELSGGMRKRVGIARAIIHRPRYLIYDEPTTGLDPISSQLIDDLIVGLSREPGRTSLIITHDMDTVRHVGGEVAMIADQRLLFYGPVQDFLRSDQPYIRSFLQRSTQSRAGL
ncbi:MAG: ATP-binding cassette domain-containing protein [Bacteroidia bacterium]